MRSEFIHHRRTSGAQLCPHLAVPNSNAADHFRRRVQPISPFKHKHTGTYTLELGSPRNVCRLVSLRRAAHLLPEDWRVVYDGFRDQLEISSASKDLVFLLPGSEAEGRARLGNPASLSAMKGALVEVVRAFLYHERYRKLHQTLTTMYPLVVALPSLYSAPTHILPALVSALLYSNGMAASEPLQQPFYGACARNGCWMDGWMDGRACDNLLTTHKRKQWSW